MQKRLDRRFLPWLIAHSFEFWYYYIGATASLYALHYYQSEIPRMAKELGDKVALGQIADVSIMDFIYLAIGILIFRTLSRLLFFYPARIQQKNLRLELISTLENANPQTYKSYNDGQLFQTIYNDLNRIRGFVGFALLQVGNIVIASFIFIPKINEFNPDLLIAFSPMLVCIAIFTSVAYFMQPVNAKGMDLAGEVQNFIIESYDAKKTIKNFHSEKSFFNLFKFHSNAELWNFFVYSASRNISFPLIKIGSGTSLIWGAIIIKDSGQPGTALIFFAGFLYLVLEPLMLMSWIGVVASQGFASWARIKKLLTSIETKPDLKISGELFDAEVLFWGRPQNLKINEEKWNVLVGDTGVGKSYVLENYALLLETQGKSISFIQQEPFLYNDTIKNNIFLNLDETPEKLEQVKKYLQMFALDTLDHSLDEILKMEVGENGKKISGGQAKRVALIRSLISEVDFILWDDPFSSVDLILERDILAKLKDNPILKNKTFVFSSHRLSTVRSCEWLIFLDKNESKFFHGNTAETLNKENRVSEYFNKQLV
jgi:ATP-binding cassette subfamily B protein